MSNFPVQTGINPAAGTYEIEKSFDKWKVGLFDVCHKGCSSCLYGCFCPGCANATARSEMDDSNWCFNWLCLGTPCGARNIIRESYHIEGNCAQDIFQGLFCMCCSNVQLLSEVDERGPANMQWGANRSPSEQPWTHGTFDCCVNGGNCLYGCCLPCFAIPHARTRFDGSNCIFNYFCLTGPTLRSIIREGYNLEGTCLNDILCICFCMPCTAVQLLNEVEARGKVTKTYVTAPAHKSMNR